MLTLSLLYVYLYISCLVALFYLLTCLVPLNYFINYSLSIFITFLKKYTTFQPIFFGIFICLCGLPPVGLFLIKFNILSYVISYNHFITILILYIVFLLNMFYYLQVFNFKNNKSRLIELINNNIFKIWNKHSYNYLFNLKFSTYYFYFYFIFFLFFFFFFIWFITDFFYIFSNFLFIYVNKKSINIL